MFIYLPQYRRFPVRCSFFRQRTAHPHDRWVVDPDFVRSRQGYMYPLLAKRIATFDRRSFSLSIYCGIRY